ncbi:hypothetical protein VIGAN_06073700 [Vigna angularis var. angularis]|uniref:Uncharacterized protein n=1 Tax=Vigna angularis var. angularis TaxID=157739 RepID=A0A0S3SA85_PHAAN|nr:hypothetical protein VIGAN_06073700 [Vigna angularis var. angularis]
MMRYPSPKDEFTPQPKSLSSLGFSRFSNKKSRTLWVWPNPFFPSFSRNLQTLGVSLLQQKGRAVASFFLPFMPLPSKKAGFAHPLTNDSRYLANNAAPLP